eukprot:comp21811_c0_seq1/m.49076 comp21811_c0_seq1/g.49076  ORF comp21811_c0_seq1/g.49076 comp21811_c0_seq1/m.49076 type:complete len:367 (+) comp21811_c0_seq1:68-1168(+)
MPDRFIPPDYRAGFLRCRSGGAKEAGKPRGRHRDTLLQRDIPGADDGVLASRGDRGLREPCDGIHAVRVRGLDVHTLAWGCHGPHIDGRINRARDKTGALWRPGERGHARGMEHPALDLDGARGAVPDIDLAQSIARRKQRAVRRVGQRSDGLAVLAELALGLKHVAVQRVQMHKVVVATHRNLNTVLRHSDRSRVVLDSKLRDRLAAADHIQRTSAHRDGNLRVRLRASDADGRRGERCLVGRIFVGLERGEAHRVVARRAVQVVLEHREPSDLVRVACALEGGIAALADRIAADLAAGVARVQMVRALVKGQRMHAALVAVEHAQRLGRVVDVEIVDVAAEPKRDEMVASPQTADLHVLNTGLV